MSAVATEKDCPFHRAVTLAGVTITSRSCQRPFHSPSGSNFGP